jgi:hypothetical protein
MNQQQTSDGFLTVGKIKIEGSVITYEHIRI